jgi:hypothetical protein
VVKNPVDWVERRLCFMNWAKSRERRDQLVLFPTRLAVTDAQNDKLAFPVTDRHDPSQAFCAWA